MRDARARPLRWWAAGDEGRAAAYGTPIISRKIISMSDEVGVPFHLSRFTSPLTLATRLIGRRGSPWRARGTRVRVPYGGEVTGGCGTRVRVPYGGEVTGGCGTHMCVPYGGGVTGGLRDARARPLRWWAAGDEGRAAAYGTPIISRKIISMSDEVGVPFHLSRFTSPLTLATRLIGRRGSPWRARGTRVRVPYGGGVTGGCGTRVRVPYGGGVPGGCGTHMCVPYGGGVTGGCGTRVRVPYGGGPLVTKKGYPFFVTIVPGNERFQPPTLITARPFKSPLASF